MIAGYGAAQAIVTPGLQYQLVIGAVGIALIAVFTVSRCRGLPTTKTVGISIAVALAVWILAKESFVRHDASHGSLFIAYVSIVLAALASTRMRRVWVVGALMTTTVLTLVSASVNPIPVYRPDRAVRDFVEEASTLFSSSQRRALVSNARATMQRQFGIPPPMVAAMRGHTVTVDPWELAVTWAYPGVVFDPLPVIQDYTAYAASLDDLNAADLAGPDAPQFIVKQPNLTIDGRLAIFEPPRTQVVMECRYRQTAASLGWQLLGRSEDRCSGPRTISVALTRSNGMVEVPRTAPGNAVVATFSVPEPAWWSFQAVALSPPEVCFQSVQAGLSRVKENRFIVGTAGDWHLLRPASTLGYSAPYIPPTIEALSFSVCGARSPMAGVKVTFQSIAMAPFGGEAKPPASTAGKGVGSGSEPHRPPQAGSRTSESA